MKMGDENIFWMKYYERFDNNDDFAQNENVIF